MSIASLFEPEELIGGLWHRLVGDVGKEEQFPQAGVSLKQNQRRLEIYFRAIGGHSGVVIKPIAPQNIDYRKKRLARIGNGSNLVTRARFDGDTLFLPNRLQHLPLRQDNERLYKWLTAFAAIAGNQHPQIYSDPLQNDLAFMRFAHGITGQIFDQFPGLQKLHNLLCPQLLAHRPLRALPEQEAAIEQCIHGFLGGEMPSEQAQEFWKAITSSEEAAFENIKAKPGYKTFLPLILWGEITPNKTEKIERRLPEEEEDADPALETDQEQARKAKRQKSDEVERDDPLILHRFESILSWSEMMNINRGVEDEEEDAAKKAADDHDEIGLADLSRKAATKLKFDLDLAPNDVEHERLSAKYTYHEWDYRINDYHLDHCRVLAGPAPLMPEGELWQPDRSARKRIRAVKRQFEALRSRRKRLLAQSDGDELDMDALIRAQCDLAATGEGSHKIFSTTRQSARDLSVSILIDISRSSESWIDGRQVMEISKEALMALTLGLTACGDDHAIYSFSSLRRARVTVSNIKSFDEVLGPRVFSRIGALKPGFYTRFGAAMRHVTGELLETGSGARLLLVLTDGKPNDLDHYEGRYGVEDTAMAVREARRAGIGVFGITIDKKAQSYFPHIFGQNAYAITTHANDLIKALPKMYRHLVV